MTISSKHPSRNLLRRLTPTLFLVALAAGLWLGASPAPSAAQGPDTLDRALVPPGLQDCDPVECYLYCPYGFQQNELGCEVCACLDPAEAVQDPDPVDGDGPKPPPSELCDPIECDLHCPFGFKTDEKGCEICECRDAPND